jgi:nucleotide-binding universal stress UspA family protein
MQPKILVPVDDSPAARRAVAQASERAGRDRALLGSVSDRVLRQASIPVLVVREAE